jgi:hypothetical protein
MMGYIGTTMAALALTASLYGQQKVLNFDLYVPSAGQTVNITELGKPLLKSVPYQRQVPVMKDGKKVGYNMQTFYDFVVDVDGNKTPDIVAQTRDGVTVDQIVLNREMTTVNEGLMKRLGTRIRKSGVRSEKVTVQSTRGNV